MNTQADNLRFLARKMKADLQSQILDRLRTTRIISITSGKGGVGKSNFAVNLAIALAKYKQQVILLDADFGLANVDVILGISPPYNLAHVVAEDKTIREIMCEGPEGIQIIPGGSGMQELANLQEWQLENFLLKLSQLEGRADYLLIDTGAGLSKTVQSFTLAADEVIVVTTTEPTALTDAYGMIKTVRKQGYQGNINLVVNRVGSESEGEAVFYKLKAAASRFLRYSVEYLGPIREDPKVVCAIKEQKALTVAYPDTLAAKDILAIAARIAGQEYQGTGKQGIKAFFQKFSNIFR